MVGVKHRAQKVHGRVVVRLGITGTGVAPNYRVEGDDGQPLAAIDGNNHAEWPAGVSFEAPDNWSTAALSRADVEAVIASGGVRQGD